MTARSAPAMDEDDEEEEEIDGEYEQSQPFGAVQDSDDEEEDVDDDDIQEDLDDDDTNQALIVQSADKSENSESDNGDDDDDDIHKSIKASQNLDRQRGQAVVAQLQSYDKLLEVRIGMQKAVTQVNNICADEEKDFIVSKLVLLFCVF